MKYIDPKTQYHDRFVSRWDELVGWRDRRAREEQFWKRIIQNSEQEHVVDLATGTGFHSALLTSMGARVCAIDVCPNMLARARQNFLDLGLTGVETHEVAWNSLCDAVPPSSFSLAICLGNSFTHLYDQGERETAAKQFYDSLMPGGRLLVDQRNYDYIIDYGALPPAKSGYAGKVIVELVSISADDSQFSYTFPDGGRHFLNMYPIRIGSLINIFLRAGFSYLGSIFDYSYSRVTSPPSFVVHEFLKGGESNDS